MAGTLSTFDPALRGRWFRRIGWLGKWSMLDVLILALLVFYAKATQFADAVTLPGVYFFAASVFLTMFAYGMTGGEETLAGRRGLSYYVRLDSDDWGGTAAWPGCSHRMRLHRSKPPLVEGLISNGYYCINWIFSRGHPGETGGVPCHQCGTLRQRLCGAACVPASQGKNGAVEKTRTSTGCPTSTSS